MKLKVLMVVVLSFLLATCAFSKVDKEYYDNGKVREVKEYSTGGTLEEAKYYREDGSLELLEKYDKVGDKIGEANYDEQGKLVENDTGWAAIRWKYENGNMVAEGYYDSSGKLKEYIQYDPSGDLIAKEYVGNSGTSQEEEDNPSPTVAGESISYFDKYGRPEGTTSVEPDTAFYPFPLWWDD